MKPVSKGSYRLRLVAKRQESRPTDKLRRDTVSFYASIIAFAISIATFYSTQIRRLDSLSVKSGPLIFRPTESDSKTIKIKAAPQYFVFANSGNRAIAITKLYITMQFFPQLNTDCTLADDSRKRFMLKLDDPFIIKAADITGKSLALELDDSITPDNLGNLNITLAKPTPSSFYLRVCLSVVTVTPDESAYSSHLLQTRRFFVDNDIIRHSVDADQSGMIFEPKLIYERHSWGLF